MIPIEGNTSNSDVISWYIFDTPPLNTRFHESAVDIL